MTAEAAVSSPLLGREYLADPDSVIARLREEDPVHFIPGAGCWLVTRHEDVRRLFTDPNVTVDPRAWERYEPAPAGSFRRWADEEGFFAAPPEAHARLRRLVSAALTRGAVARMEDQIRQVVDQFAAPLRGRSGVVDLAAEYTDPIPNVVISRITGIPAKGDDEARFRELAQDVIRGFLTFATEDQKQRADEAAREISDWVRSMAEEGRRNPCEDLVSDLVRVNDMDDRMTNDEVVSVIVILITAGSETTALGGAAALRALLHHPAQLEKLRRHRALLPNAVNEVLRFDFGLGPGPSRYALRDFELRGKRIRKGQQILLSFSGAHRDPSVFPDPDHLDLERDTKALTIFGHGPHFCLGANLARQELRCMIDAALDFLPPGAKLREDLIEWRAIEFFRRMETLPVDFSG